MKVYLIVRNADIDEVFTASHVMCVFDQSTLYDRWSTNIMNLLLSSADLVLLEQKKDIYHS